MEKVTLDIFREEELSETIKSFPNLQGLKSRKVFKEKYVAKNAWDGVARTVEFIQTSNYFYFNPFFHFLKQKRYIHLIHLA